MITIVQLCNIMAADSFVPKTTNTKCFWLHEFYCKPWRLRCGAESSSWTRCVGMLLILSALSDTTCLQPPHWFASGKTQRQHANSPWRLSFSDVAEGCKLMLYSTQCFEQSDLVMAASREDFPALGKPTMPTSATTLSNNCRQASSPRPPVASAHQSSSSTMYYATCVSASVCRKRQGLSTLCVKSGVPLSDKADIHGVRDAV